jgi:hypothetical protein
MLTLGPREIIKIELGKHTHKMMFQPKSDHVFSSDLHEFSWRKDGYICQSDWWDECMSVQSTVIDFWFI